MTPEDDRLHRSGFLEKESKGDNWNKRFFILDETSLKYYKKKPSVDDEDSLRCRGEIKIKKIVKVGPCPIWTGKDYCFVLDMSSGPDIYLVANSEKDMEAWIDKIVSHPLAVLASGKGPVDDTASPTKGSGPANSYQTKVVGGVVIRKQIITSVSSELEGMNIQPTPETLERSPTSKSSTSSLAGLEREPTACSTATSSSSSISPSHVSRSTSSAATRGSAHRKEGTRLVKCGFCVKQGGRRRTWKRRFFLLDPFGLAYYRFATDKEPVKNIPLPFLTSAASCDNHMDRDNVVQIGTVGRVFYMQAENTADCQAWVKAIQSVLPDPAVRPSSTISEECSTEASSGSSFKPVAGQAPSRHAMKSAKNLWKMSLGKCRDYLQPSDDSEEDEE